MFRILLRISGLIMLLWYAASLDAQQRAERGGEEYYVLSPHDAAISQARLLKEATDLFAKTLANEHWKDEFERDLAIVREASRALQNIAAQPYHDAALSPRTEGAVASSDYPVEDLWTTFHAYYKEQLEGIEARLFSVLTTHAEDLQKKAAIRASEEGALALKKLKGRLKALQLQEERAREGDNFAWKLNPITILEVISAIDRLVRLESAASRLSPVSIASTVEAEARELGGTPSSTSLSSSGGDEVVVSPAAGDHSP